MTRTAALASLRGLGLLAGLASLLCTEGCKPAQQPRTNTGATRSAKAAPKPSVSASLRYVSTPIGSPVSEFGRPWVTHVTIADLDRDGLNDVLYAEGQKNTVRWIRQSPQGVFSEHVIGRDIAGPAHVSVADIQGRGKLDVLVASMGQITPNNDQIGAVVVLEHVVDRQYRKRVLLEGVARVTDLRAANLAGHADGRLDLVVGQFGYAQGETRWMENKGNWQFESHQVSNLSGCVHTPVADFDGDGRTDFAALISQEWEEVHWFQNLGSGNFKDHVSWGSTNEDYGSSGLEVVDLNRDGRPDLLYTNGDGFDYAGYGSRPWHGVQWMENQGNGRFAFHRIGTMPGAYAPCAADLNGDGHLDVVTVSGFADWDDPKAISLMAWVNDGLQNFSPVILAHRPTQLVTAAVGDLDGDGIPEIVTGGFYAYPPYEHMSNVLLWRRQ